MDHIGIDVHKRESQTKVLPWIPNESLHCTPGLTGPGDGARMAPDRRILGCR